MKDMDWTVQNVIDSEARAACVELIKNHKGGPE